MSHACVAIYAELNLKRMTRQAQKWPAQLIFIYLFIIIFVFLLTLLNIGDDFA